MWLFLNIDLYHKYPIYRNLIFRRKKHFRLVPPHLDGWDEFSRISWIIIIMVLSNKDTLNCSDLKIRIIKDSLLNSLKPPHNSRSNTFTNINKLLIFFLIILVISTLLCTIKKNLMVFFYRKMQFYVIFKLEFLRSP